MFLLWQNIYRHNPRILPYVTAPTLVGGPPELLSNRIIYRTYFQNVSVTFYLRAISYFHTVFSQTFCFERNLLVLLSFLLGANNFRRSSQIR